MTTPPNRSRPATCVLAVATVSALTAASVLASSVPAAAESDTTTTVVEESLSSAATTRTSPTSWTYRDSSTAPFTTLGVSWRAGTQVKPTIQFRTRTDGVWTSWTAAPETAATPAEAERAGTDPVYVGDSDGVEVRLTTPSGTTVADPSVALIDPGEAVTPTPQTTMTTRASAYLPPKPAVVTRAQWGADESWRCATPSYTSALQAAIVHHTAGANSYTKAESAGIVRGIYAYHTKTLGWCDVGYNVLVDKYGTVFEGRAGGLDKPVLGAHATSWNSATTGVSLMGNFETAAAPAVMMESAAKVIAWKLAPYGLDPRSRVTLAGKTIYRIAGHGDVMQTACPGVNVRTRLPALRDRVAALMQAPAAAPAPSPTPAPAAPGTATTAIGKRWQALGGGSGVLGWPLKPEAPIADGSWREFKAHDMFASPRTAAFWTTGAVRTQYRALGTAKSALGFPTSDEKDVPGVTGARMNSFENGWIIWSSGNGTHAVTGSFFTRYSGDPALRTRLGAPTSARVTSEFGVPSQTFRGGRMFEVGGTVVVLEGAAYRHFAAQSSTARASIGAPKAAASSVTASVTGTVASVQVMQKGTYVTVGTKAVVVKGSIHGTWREFGGEKGRLGLPTGDEKAVTGGWSQTFERGSISRVNGETLIRHR